jgi:dethiobiotin synthase
MSSFIISGTGTDVGKSAVCAVLLDFLRSSGADYLPYKPVQSGCVYAGSELMAPDLEYVLNYNSLRPTALLYDQLCTYKYEPACSPHLAAALSETPPDLNVIYNQANSLASQCDGVLLEGAGGLMVPLNKSILMIDLFDKLKWPVILVAPAGLGTLNHCLLSVEALNRRGIPIQGIILNHASEADPADYYIIEDNLATLRTLTGLKVLGPMPYDLGLASGVRQSPPEELLRGLSDFFKGFSDE